MYFLHRTILINILSAVIIILKQTTKVLKKRYNAWKALKAGETQLTKHDVEMEKIKLIVTKRA